MLVPLHEMQPIVRRIWEDKYRYIKADGSSDEDNREASIKRVCDGIYANDPDAQEKERAIRSMLAGVWCPAGRIHSGAGTNKRVTLINCFVLNPIADSMVSEGADRVGIMDSLSNAARTQQMGGGIGQDFSTLRPKGALVKRTGSISTGPLEFMDMWDAMCKTIMSAGERRGAMMATMRCDHPDIIDFIHAKSKPGKFTNFNVSVLITDDFMNAVAKDKMWKLGFPSPRRDGNHDHVVYGGTILRNGGDSENTDPWYVYSIIKARDLWSTILEQTYKTSEPGVIFIDRINTQNNLYYCETITATNPCGEQPLPPHGACDLGAINLAKCVVEPFSDKAYVDYEAIKEATHVGVRFLDNVLDETQYPLEEQKHESMQKRRIGLGVTGLANFLQQLQIHYGSERACKQAEEVMNFIANQAYHTSVDLAKERDPFPLFDAKKFLEGVFPLKLDSDLRERIRLYGIRNGVLLTVAPTGTTSIYYDYASSGIEPTFAFNQKRKVRNGDGNYSVELAEDYALGVYKEQPWANGSLPDYMVTATELTVDQHLNMQAACQKWVDASISKTINVPEEIDYEEFKHVYSKAYELGLKGCTTYRPSEIRGSILESDDKPSQKPRRKSSKLVRPNKVAGETYKLKWTGPGPGNYYITINDRDCGSGIAPFECFIHTTTGEHEDWLNVMSRLISSIFRLEADATFIVNELNKIHSPKGGSHVDGKYIPSLAAAIGNIIKDHMVGIGYLKVAKPTMVVTGATNGNDKLGDRCPMCSTYSYVTQEGCGTCYECGFSECG